MSRVKSHKRGRAPRQLKFCALGFKAPKPFGGSRLRGNPKGARPFSSRCSMHIVLRARDGRGARSLFAQQRAIEKVVNDQARLSGVKVYDAANAGNHLHILLRAPSKDALTAFLKATGGLIARKMTGRERGRGRVALGSFSARSSGRAGAAPAWDKRESFWIGRPFSRLVADAAYPAMKRYMMINRLDLIDMPRETARSMLAEVERLQRKGLIPRRSARAEPE